MPYALICHDKPDHLDMRLATRDAHLAFAKEFGDRILAGGPFLNEDDQMIGSMIVLDVPTLAEAEAFAAADPYGKAGLFESVTIRRWKQTVGT